MSDVYKEETKSIQKMDSSDEDESEIVKEAEEVQHSVATDTEVPSVSSGEKQEEDGTVSVFSRNVTFFLENKHYLVNVISPNKSGPQNPWQPMPHLVTVTVYL